MNSTGPTSFKIPCPHCAVHVEFPSEMHGQIHNCPSCGLSMVLTVPGVSQPQPPALPVVSSPPTQRQEVATAERGRDSFGSGCVFQLLAVLLMPLALLVGGTFQSVTVAGVLFFACLGILVYGGRLARPWQCSRCKGKIAGSRASKCPHCGAIIR